MAGERETVPAPCGDGDHEDELALAADFANTMMGLSGGLLIVDRALGMKPPDLSGVRAHLHAARAAADLATRLARRIVHGPRSADASLGAVELVHVLETALTIAGPQLENVTVHRAYDSAPTVCGRDDDLVRIFVSLLLHVASTVDPRRESARLRVAVVSEGSASLVRIGASLGDDTEGGASSHIRRSRNPIHGLERSLCRRLIADQKGTLSVDDDGSCEIALTVTLLAAHVEAR